LGVNRISKEATVDVARSGLFPREDAQKIAAEIDSLIARLVIVIERIP